MVKKQFTVVLWGGGARIPTGKVKMWTFETSDLGSQDKHLRRNTLLLPAGGSREPAGASLTEAWLVVSICANTVAAWVVVL